MQAIGDIAAAAIAKVELKLSDAVQACTLLEEQRGAFNATTGQYDYTLTSVATGKAVILTERPNADPFPDYVIGPNEILVFLQGLSTAPKEGMTLRIGSTDRAVKRVADLLGAGTLFYAVLQ